MYHRDLKVGASTGVGNAVQARRPSAHQPPIIAQNVGECTTGIWKPAPARASATPCKPV